MTKVAVFGSNSFSGSDFIDLLLAEGGYDVLGTSRSPEKSAVMLPYLARKNDHFRFLQADFNHDHDLDRLMDALDDFAPEIIVNFAAQSEVGPSWEHPEHWFETNTVSLAKLLNRLKDRRYIARYVHISSPEVYGSFDRTVTEDHPVAPSTPYAASKAAADMLIGTFASHYGFPVITIRTTNVYGAHQQLFKIIPRCFIYVRTGRTIQLHGGGKAVKSFIHIRDASRGLLDAMTKGDVGELYHFASDRGYSVREVVQTICTLLGKDFSKVTEDVAERPGQDAAYLVDSTKARHAFGWRPEIDLETGLRDVRDWIEANWDAILQMPHEYIHAA
jgi:dTDP-glucose 4,6-dehydratase